MLHILKPLNDVNDPTWSIILSLVLLLAGVLYIVVYIIRMAMNEFDDADENPGESHHH